MESRCRSTWLHQRSPGVLVRPIAWINRLCCYLPRLLDGRVLLGLFQPALVQAIIRLAVLRYRPSHAAFLHTDVPVAFLTVNYLSEDLAPTYAIRMPSLGLISIFSSFTPESDPNATIADISLLDIHTEIIQQSSRKAWWRRYQLIFTCTWGPAATPSLRGLPITDPVVLDRLGVDLERSLRQFLDVLSVFEVERLSNGTVAVGADDPRERPFVYQTFGNWSIATSDATDGGGSDAIAPIEPLTSLRETGSFTVRVHARDWVRNYP